jgi:hypothetical protein
LIYLPLLLYDWLSRQRLKDRSGYKPFFSSHERDGKEGGRQKPFG